MLGIRKHFFLSLIHIYFDVVDASNLQRQIIHSTADIGRKKLDSAEEKLKALNPSLKVVKYDTLLSSANALDILKDFDVIADGTDTVSYTHLAKEATAVSSGDTLSIIPSIAGGC